MNLNVKLFSVIFMFLMFSSCSSSNLDKKTIKIQKQDGTFVSVIAEIADTEESRTYGFMNRKKIPDGTGMLFVFDYDQVLSFWMKNTPTALSIAYITSDGYIKDIFDMKPFSLSSVVSTGYVRYALEVPKGWFDKVGIKKGDKGIVLGEERNGYWLVIFDGEIYQN